MEIITGSIPLPFTTLLTGHGSCRLSYGMWKYGATEFYTTVGLHYIRLSLYPRSNTLQI